MARQTIVPYIGTVVAELVREAQERTVKSLHRKPIQQRYKDAMRRRGLSQEEFKQMAWEHYKAACERNARMGLDVIGERTRRAPVRAALKIDRGRKRPKVTLPKVSLPE